MDERNYPDLLRWLQNLGIFKGLYDLSQLTAEELVLGHLYYRLSIRLGDMLCEDKDTYTWDEIYHAIQGEEQ